MSFRPGQSGTVVRKGTVWHGRFYVDVPGQEKRRKASVPLGSIRSMTKTQAKRKLRSMLEQMGLNDDCHLERTHAAAKTFGTEAAWWRDNKLEMFKPSCRETMGSHLDKYLLARFGAMPLAAIDERAVQEFIAELVRVDYKRPNGKRRKLSPKTIRNIVGVLKLILGEKVWRDWQLRYPESPDKEQRWFTPEEMRLIVKAAKGQWKVMFATLAGTGMRCGECFGLHVEDLDLANGTIIIRRSVRDGEDGTLKTKKGYRKVHIEPALSAMLAAHLDGRTGGRVFQTNRGTPFCRSNVRRKLNQILDKLKLAPAGLHAFRHGRVSLLQEKGVAGDLILEQVGHSNLRTTSGYTHFRDDYRQRVARELGLFAQGDLAEKLPDGPKNTGLVPIFAPASAQAGAA